MRHSATDISQLRAIVRDPSIAIPTTMKIVDKSAYVVVAGVAVFFGVVDFLDVFLDAAFFGTAVFAGPLVTRPDLVLPRTFFSSTIAGACKSFSGCFGLP